MGSSTGSRFGKLEPKTKMNLAQVLIQIEIIYKIDNPYSQTNSEMVRIWYFLQQSVPYPNLYHIRIRISASSCLHQLIFSRDVS